MKTETIVTIAAVIITVGLLCLANKTLTKKYNPRDYQIEVKLDSVYIYDGERLVDQVAVGDSSALGNLILTDNY